MKKKIKKIAILTVCLVATLAATVLPSFAESPDELFYYDVLDNFRDPDPSFCFWYAPPCFDFQGTYLDCYPEYGSDSFLLSVFHELDFDAQFFRVDIVLRGLDTPDCLIYTDFGGYSGTAFSITQDRLYAGDGTPLASFDEYHKLHLTYWVDVNSMNLYYIAWSDDPDSSVALGSFNMFDFSDYSGSDSTTFFSLEVFGSSEHTGSIEFFDIVVEQLPNLYANTTSRFFDLSTGYDQGYSDGYEIGFTEGEAGGYNMGWSDGNDEGYSEGVEVGKGLGYSDGHDDGYAAGYEVGTGDGYDTGYSSGLAQGEELGYAEGERYGQSVGYEQGYNVGAHDGEIIGYNNGIKDSKFMYDAVNGMWHGVVEAYETLAEGITLFDISFGSVVSTAGVLLLVAFVIKAIRG